MGEEPLVSQRPAPRRVEHRLYSDVGHVFREKNRIHYSLGNLTRAINTRFLNVEFTPERILGGCCLWAKVLYPCKLPDTKWKRETPQIFILGDFPRGALLTLLFRIILGYPLS